LAVTAGSSGPSGAISAQSFAINGVACPEAVNWSGGNARGDVVLSGANKHLAGVDFEPVAVSATLPLSAALLGCVADLCANRGNPQTLQLSNLDANGAPVNTVQALNAVLAEVRLPALDAASHDALRVTLIFSVERVAAAVAPTVVRGGRPAAPSVATFKVTVAGLDTSRVSRIEPLVITRTTPSAVGINRTATPAPSSVDVPNLSLTFGAPAPADWSAWRDDFLVNGNNLGAQEKDGSLQILASDLHTVLLSLQFSHLGVFRLAAQPDANNLPNGSRADLYCENITVGGDTTVAPANSTTPTTPASGSTAPGPNPATTTPVTTAPVGNPADKGARDPADFARPPNTVRLDYSASLNSGATDEAVTYSATTLSDDLQSFYTNYLSGAGWTMTELHENDGGPKDTHQIYGHWTTKDNNSLDLRLSDLQPGAVVISVHLKRSPPQAPGT
jgi:hypothetical protein